MHKSKQFILHHLLSYLMVIYVSTSEMCGAGEKRIHGQMERQSSTLEVVLFVPAHYLVVWMPIVDDLM